MSSKQPTDLRRGPVDWVLAKPRRNLLVTKSFRSLFLLLALAPACVRGPQLQVTPSLGLRRVVVYRNGVAYFERGGHVTGDNVEFRVRQREVGDFLATLAVMERGGSSVQSAAFPLPRDVTEGEAPPSPNEQRTVHMRLDGRDHDLVVGYMAETPIWRPSYRLVMGPNDAQIQAYGVVHNLSGEDWRDVSLSLVTGAPVSFRSELADPVITDRPLVTDRGEVIDAVPQGATTLAEGPPPPPVAQPVSAAVTRGDIADEDLDDNQEQSNLESERRGGALRSRRAASTRPQGGMGRVVTTTGIGARPTPARAMDARYMNNRGPSGNSAAAPNFEGPSRPRSLASLAAVAVQGGTTRYDLPQRVTVPDRTATMVLLASADVPGERLYLFAPDGGVSDSVRHPFNVARFVNRTGSMLERGPLAIFENGAFLGQGMLDPMPNDATAVVPFALERGLAVESSSTADVEGARLMSIRRGAVQIERFRTQRTTYVVRNGMDRAARVLLKIATADGTSLFEAPTGTEPSSAASLVPVQIAARGRAEQLVVLRTPFTYTTHWGDPQAIEAIRAFIQGGRAPRELIDALTTALDLQEQITRFSGERAEHITRRNDLQTNAQETRDNLEAIRRNPGAADLRTRLTQRLTTVSAEIDQVSRRIVELDTQIGERRVRLSEATRTLSVEPPTPAQAAAAAPTR
ncbi:MAG: DUF4139 domain-containing protein [Deltaproteobacteria bacterium]|nr:DUF4139 domain-containing protein [Deltaproteobacteria bacterium]